jgi:dihydroxyacetone kinase-like protein
MSFSITTPDYLNYFAAAAERIKINKDYITGLDAATGDGDHWANLNKGFQTVLESQ